VMVAVMEVVAGGKWARGIRRIAISFTAFLPISFLLMVPMLFAGEQIFPWVLEPVHGKEPWLNMPFLAARNLVLLAACYGLSLAFAYWALRPDLGALRDDEVPDRLRPFYARFTRGWLGAEAEGERAFRKLRVLGTALALVFALAFTVVAFDFVMSLEPHWFSTMLGGYFFMGAFLSGIVAVILGALYWRRTFRLEGFIGFPLLHDLGKLNFAFCVFWAYLFWSQFIVIWYGMLPHDQHWVIHRFTAPFDTVSALVVLAVFALPFFGLLSVKAKTTPKVLGTFAGIVFFGLWLERYLLVYPSFHYQAPALPFGWQEIGITAAFAGLFLAAVLFFANRFPMVQRWITVAERAELLGTSEAPAQVVTE
jgi:hypothetical protein